MQHQTDLCISLWPHMIVILVVRKACERKDVKDLLGAWGVLPSTTSRDTFNTGQWLLQL